MDDRVESSKSDRLDNRLASLLYRFDCPTAMELGEFYLGMIGEPRRSSLARHLETCPKCTAEYAALRTFMLQADPEIQVDSRTVEQPGVLEKLRWLVAVLVAPPSSLQGALAPAYRGSGGALRNYRADDYDISLEVHDDPEHAGRKQIVGLVLGLDEGSLAVGLALPGAIGFQSSVVTDESGNFVLPDVAPGIHDLIIHRADGTLNIRIPNFEVVP
jgi:hypothetical protein